jgi:TatA/E family protein of Tat protein translocase
MGIENPVHILFIALVALVVLGPKRLPEVARALGQGIREFRESINTHPDQQIVHEPVPGPSMAAPQVVYDPATAPPVAPLPLEVNPVVAPQPVAPEAAVPQPVAAESAPDSLSAAAAVEAPVAGLPGVEPPPASAPGGPEQGQPAGG